MLRKYRKLLILIFFLILYVLVLTVYLLGERLLAQHGLEYRAGISSLGFFWIYLLPFPAGGVLLVCLYRWLKKKYDLRPVRIFCKIFFAVYLLASVCLAGYLEAMHLIHLNYEEVLDNGYLKIYETSFPDASWYYCAPVSFFAREPLTQVTSQVDGRYEDDGAASGDDVQAEEDSRSPVITLTPEENPDMPDGSGAAEQDMEDSAQGETEYNEDDNSEETDAGQDTSPAAGDASGSLSIPENAARAIYEAVFAPEGKTYQETYNAKGNLYIVLDSYETTFQDQQVTARETLVYDRKSQNGKCQLFVYYQEHYDSQGNQLDNTSILNFYAVDMTTGQVTAGDKTAWSQPASKAYYEATGEY